MVDYRIQKDAEAPVPRRGRPRKWAIPLEDISETGTLTLYMNKAEAKATVSAVRSFVARQQRRLGRKFSVILSDDGIVICRRIR